MDTELKKLTNQCNLKCLPKCNSVKKTEQIKYSCKGDLTLSLLRSTWHSHLKIYIFLQTWALLFNISQRAANTVLNI